MTSATFSGLNPIVQALLAALFTWGVTALGAASVFFKKEFNRHLLNGMLGFAAGVMIAASFWSLLAPAIDMSAAGPLPKWLPAVSGFLHGRGFFVADGQAPPPFAQRPAPGPGRRH